jgi:DNA invertase Pin-like site-specific DNA recombinase
MIIEKIGVQHRERKAMLYIRQSSAQQVLHNRESQTLQYAMRERLVTLGWSEIEIIDEDLGLSAAGGTARAGFERMVAEVCLGKVGAVAAREVSRFARNSRDWQHSSKCAAWSIPCSLIRRRSMSRDKATIGCCWA